MSLGSILDLEKQVQYTDDDRLKIGADWASGLPNQGLVKLGDAAQFNPLFAPDIEPSLDDAAFGIYVFNLGDYDQEIELAFGVSDPPQTEQDLYYAIANYATGRWEWHQSDGSRVLNLPDYMNYISPGGHIFTAVAMTGTDQGQLDYIRIGGGFAPTGDLDADVKLGGYPLTVNLLADFIDVDGTIVEYRWDFNNDDTIDETSTTANLEHVYAVPGTYITRVHAVDNDDLSGSDFVTINVTGVLPPNPPINVVASDGSWGGQIHINWDPPETGPTPKGFEIFRSDSENGTYESVGAVSFAFKEFSDTSITDEETYWYYVISLHDTIGNSVPSDKDDGYMGVLNPPTDVACGQGTLADKISIGWSHPAGGATPDGYDIYRSQTVDGLKVFVASVDFVEFYQDTTVPDGKQYYYFLQSRKTNFSNSDYSEPALGYLAQLKAPTNVAASDDTSPLVVTVTWTHSAGPQFPTGYAIYRSTADDGAYFKIDTTGYVETYDDATATDGAVYYYKVAATKTGWTEAQNETPDSGYVGLGAPQFLVASDDEIDQITVDWFPAATGVAPDEYDVYRADSLEGTYTVIGTTSNTEFVDTVIVGGTTYYYKALAKKAGYNDSPFSNIDDGMTAPE